MLASTTEGSGWLALGPWLSDGLCNLLSGRIRRNIFRLHYSTSLKQFGITQVIGKQLCSLTCLLSSLVGLSCFFLFFKERAFGWIWTWKRVQQTASGHKRLSHEFILHQGPSFLLSMKRDWSGIGFFHHLHFQTVNVNSLWVISLTWITLYTCISAYLHENKIGIHNEVPLDSQRPARLSKKNI